MGPIGSDNTHFLDPPRARMGQSVAMLVPKCALVRRRGGWALRGQSVTSYLRHYFAADDSVGLGHGVRFADEFAVIPRNAGYRSRKPAGTAFVVEHDTVITAGHCLRETNPGALYAMDELYLVFDYGEQTQVRRFVGPGQVVDGSDITVVSGQYSPDNINIPDGALLRLPETAVRPGLSWATPPTVEEGQEVYMLGHRHGLPATITYGRITSDLKGRFPFVFSDLTMYEGQSGSPVLDAATDRVIGWAVGGLPHVGYGLAVQPSGKVVLDALAQPPIHRQGYPYQENATAGTRVMLYERSLPSSNPGDIRDESVAAGGPDALYPEEKPNQPNRAKPLSRTEAFLAAYAFLENWYELTHSEDVGSLLGSMSLLEDGITADPALWEDWCEAVEAVLAGKVNAKLQLK